MPTLLDLLECIIFLKFWIYSTYMQPQNQYIDVNTVEHINASLYIYRGMLEYARAFSKVKCPKTWTNVVQGL